MVTKKLWEEQALTYIKTQLEAYNWDFPNWDTSSLSPEHNTASCL